MASAAMVPPRRLPLYALFGANAISFIGDRLTTLAVTWFVLVTTGSAVRTALVAFCQILASIIATFFGGALVDRLGYKRAGVVADLASGGTVALIPTLYYTVGLAFWQLLALVFLGALLDGPGATARAALLPDLARLAGLGIERASGISQAIARGSLLIGAPLGGALVALVGPGRVLWIDAVTFAVSAALVAVAVPSPAPKVREAGERGAGGYLAELLTGLRFIRRDRLMAAMVPALMITNFLDAAAGGVVIPVYARRVFGEATDLGLMLAASGGGALAGALLFGAIGHRLPRRATFIGAFVLTGLQWWGLALEPPLAIVLAILLVTSIGAGPLNPILQTVWYGRIPADLRGRVLGALTASAYVAMPLGTLLGGLLLEWLGVRATVVGMASCYLAVTLSMLAIPAFRELDAPPAPTLTADRPRSEPD